MGSEKYEMNWTFVGIGVVVVAVLSVLIILVLKKRVKNKKLRENESADDIYPLW